jgi:hypothetical protein
MKYIKKYNENIKWDWLDEEYDENDFNHNFIGIKTYDNNRLIKWYANELPDEYIIHGDTKVDKSKEIKIVDKYKDFYIVRYTDINGKYVQLGFKKDDLIFI